ncbi:MAG: 5-oxoprolinase subunit PxpA, partial [Anaerolineales bacterium]|nr:5-oxoprolinase subunit PxpA [Anaerolineales bacterium]
MDISPEETEALVLQQIEMLALITKAEGVALTHVKPHGALYNQAVNDRGLADAIARAAKSFSVDLILVGLAGSRLCEAGLETGIKVAGEGFPDRAYNPDGRLMSRSQPGALIESPEEIAKNALKLVKDGILFGGKIVRVDTLCLHGDHPRAAENAKLLRETLTKNGIKWWD